MLNKKNSTKQIIFHIVFKQKMGGYFCFIMFFTHLINKISCKVWNEKYFIPKLFYLLTGVLNESKIDLGSGR